MKGISFQNGVEYKVQISGESWHQGGSIAGKFEAQARNAGAVLPTGFSLILAQGTDKKVKAKSPDAFKVLETISLKQSGDWKFQLALDSPVSDKSTSLYLLYGAAGSEGELNSLGQLRLNILLHQHLRDLVDVVVTHFRFLLKSISAGKSGWSDIKLDPPDSKDWAFLDQLLLQLRMNESNIEAQFTFNRKDVDAMKAGLATKSTKRVVERTWDTKELVHTFNNRLNADAATAVLEQVVAEYREAGWLNQ